MVSQVATMILIIAMVALGIWMKQRKAKKPIKGNGSRLLIPLLFFVVMCGLFVLQLTHLPQNNFEIPNLWEFIMAFILGIVFGIPLLIKTNYEVREDGFIYTKPSKGFIYIFVALVLIRIGLKEYFQTLDPIALACLSLTLALSYLGIWRIGAFLKYRRVWNSIR